MTAAKSPTPVPDWLTTAERIATEIAAEPPELQRWMCFLLDGAPFAINVLQLREVLPEACIEPVPGAPSEVLGVLNLRGEIVTVLDLRRWLGYIASAAPGPLLVVEHGGHSLALRVDTVGALLKRMPDDLLAPAPVDPVADGRRVALSCGRTEAAGQMLTLLDFAALLTPAAQGG